MRDGSTLMGEDDFLAAANCGDALIVSDTSIVADIDKNLILYLYSYIKINQLRSSWHAVAYPLEHRGAKE
jgi:hypothetical protein